MDYYKFGNGDKTFVILPGISIKSVLESKEAVADAYKAFGDDYTCYLVDYQTECKPRGVYNSCGLFWLCR